MKSPVMALDLASRTGFAIGTPGAKPVSGSISFASDGASHEAIFAGALAWTSEQITIHQPGVIVWEAPLPTSFGRGKTNVNSTTILFGLPAIVGAVAYLKKIYDVRKADTRAVRLHFIGSNPKGKVGKQLTMRKCRAIGWDVTDDNEADALAIWSYMCALIEPSLAIRTSPLFFRGAS